MMDSWKTSTRRYMPIWKTHPKNWRIKQIETMIEVCPLCNHSLIQHFYEKNYPEFCFCQVNIPINCECTCGWEEN